MFSMSRIIAKQWEVLLLGCDMCDSLFLCEVDRQQKEMKRKTMLSMENVAKKMDK